MANFDEELERNGICLDEEEENNLLHWISDKWR